MIKTLRLILCVWLIVSANTRPASSQEKDLLIGEIEKVYALASDNTEIRGLAFDDISDQAPRLFVLDHSGRIFAYQLHQNPEEGINVLKLIQIFELPKERDGSSPASPRGLTFTLENGQSIFYFLNWDDSKGDIKSQLWRCNFSKNTSEFTDLSFYPFKIGAREVLDLAYDKGKILICFDASGYTDHNYRVKRGVIQLQWNQAYDGKLEFIKHMPDSGLSPSRGVASMELEGARYLWATAGDQYIYTADAQTGRGLFHFNRPRSTDENNPGWGLAFGRDSLWVSENISGPDLILRVNVTRNLNSFYEGPRILRHLIMTIQTFPENDSANPGKAYHYYSRPYAYEQLYNQGVWPQTEKITDITGASNASVRILTYDPADDISSRQYMSLVEYADVPAQSYSSKYEIDIWTNPYRKYVYPHRVNKNIDKLAGTNYLADDSVLYNLSDTETYRSFFQRVERHIEEKYGAPADMDNPYWAARNALEYIQDHYYYPSRPQRKPAAVDYDRKHYDANPGNLKIDLSRKDYDKSQIIACSGTSVMLAGAMRFLEIPARWLGTGTQQGPGNWDTNDNGLLDEAETAPCSNGHRYTQVWLGSNYGWICFDATPTRPAFNDYDPPPPIQSQWRYMNRVAAGHLKDKRIVFNVGSELILPLYRDFEYDEKLAVDNNCGGDQRYNLQGRFDKPELWKLARHRITVKNTCFVEDVTVSGPKNKMTVAWKLKGDWDKDPQAKVSLYLQQLDQETNKPKNITKLAQAVPYNSRAALVDLSGYSGKLYRIIIRKDGDSETGGHSETFDLE